MILRLGFCFTLLSICDCARILGVFPCPSISHQKIFRKIVHELGRRGHDVVTITTDPILPKNHEGNVREIDIHDFSYQYWLENFVPRMASVDYDPVNFLAIFYGFMNELFEVQFQQPEVQELFNNRNQTFDLILVESITRVAFGASQIFKAPVIAVSSLGVLPDQPGALGFPSHPLHFPDFMSLHAKTFSLWEKVVSIYNSFRIFMMYKSMEWNDNMIIRRIFGESSPSVQELIADVDLSFISENIVMETRPVPPSVVYIGGVHLEPVKELPKSLKDYMDKSVNGIVYMSLGTNVMPTGFHSYIKEIFIKVLSSLPYDVILKWDNDELVGKFNNILTLKWTPQNDLLRHPKVKLFITQAGLQSTDEAIAASVPLVALPILADQFRNAQNYVHHGIGVKLNLDSLTEEAFRAAILKVIGDKSYKENISRLNAQIKDQPLTPLERAIWWTEYVIRNNGAKHLRSAQANISWFEFLAVDALLVIIAILFVALVLMYIVLNVMYELYNYGLSGNLEYLNGNKKCD